MAEQSKSDQIDAEFRAAGLEPLGEYLGATKERVCRCTHCGTTRYVKLTNIRKGGVACRWCHGWEKWLPWGEWARESARTWKSLGTPEESLEWIQAAGLAPITPVGDLYQAVGAVCLTCGETLVTVPERIMGSKGRPGWFSCDRCAADRKAAIREDAPALFASHGLELIGPCRGEYVAQHARCMKCGVERRVSYNALRSGTEAKCWTCITGIRPEEPHRVYLFHFPELRVNKIGITHNRDDRRILDHTFHGGVLVDSVVVSDREAALNLERVIRSIFREWPSPDVGPADFPQGGWTETWVDDAPPLDLAGLARAVSRR